MSPWERRSLHGLVGIVSLSGVVYLWMKYGLESGDPFAVVNHPWQPAMLDLHILSAPILLLLLGAIWRGHVAAKLWNGTRSNRRSGWLAIVTAPPMILSGYLLQIATDPLLRQAALLMHLVSGFAFVAAYAAHAVVALWLRRANARVAASSERAAVAPKP
jgi:hypothetical protein